MEKGEVVITKLGRLEGTKLVRLVGTKLDRLVGKLSDSGVTHLCNLLSVLILENNED